MEHSVSLLKKALLVVFALLVIYVVSDVLYRLHLHSYLERNARQHMRYGFSSTEGPLYVLDPETGYSYRPNARLHFRIYDKDNKFVRENQLISNNLGHLSLEDDFVEKPKSEFRIAILGDSFSATPTSDVTWPTELQRDLNQDPALKRITGKSIFKVINFGLDGTGFAQWPRVYKYKAKGFTPDMVIVNFIGNDLYRQFIYRATINIASDDQVMITCSSLPAIIDNIDCLNADSFVVDPNKPDYKKTVRIKKELYEKMVARLPWSFPNPELLATLLNGRLGLHPRLQFRDGSMDYFKSSVAALGASQSALRAIALQQHALLVLYHPTVEECLSKKAPLVVEELMKREGDLKIENMLDYLPLTSGQDEIRKWYNLPYDSHPSDYGARVYARAVEARVFEYLSQSNGASSKARNAAVKKATNRVAAE